jgi:hypothetical protein
MSQPPKWRIKIEHLMACNCNWGCPCSFNSPPTFGTCEAALAYRVVQGKYGDVALDGLKWVLAAIRPGPLHEGNGRGVAYLDARAKGARREALEAIATGKAGGPIGVFMATVNAGLEVRTARIEFRAAGKKSWFRVEDEVEVAFGPMRSPVSGAEHHVSALLATGLLTEKEDYFSADTFSVGANDLRFAYPGRNAIAFSHTWRGP